MKGAIEASPKRVAQFPSSTGEELVIVIRIGIVRPDLHLTVPAEDDSLPVVRQVLRSLGETVDAEEAALEDAELAVTEAMANAVEHAYGDEDGDVRVTVHPRGSELRVVVADEGMGIPEDPRTDRDGGFGLSMIEGIASSLEVKGGDGTELDMRFDMGRSNLETVDGAAPGIDPAERIMRRLVAVVAAQADLPTDRLVEALLIAEITARHALRHLIGEEIEIGLDRQGDAFELSVGPLEEGGAERVVADSEIPVVGSVVERLADGVRTEQAEDSESLVIRVGARR